MTNSSGKTLVLGIGNTLMGDEGVGVEVVRELERRGTLPEGVETLDGGTGSFLLLEPMQSAGHVILIDATIDGAPPGTVRRLEPRFSKDYPKTLTAHDIGLKDLIDAFYLMGETPRVTLYAVSIENLGEMNIGLTPPIEAIVPTVADLIESEAGL